MNRKQISIIGGIAAVLAIGVVGFSSIEKPETLSVAILVPEIHNDRPMPPPVVLSEHGTSMTEGSIATATSMEIAKIRDVVSIQRDGTSVEFVDTRLRSNGAVYNYYGTAQVNDSTTLPDFLESGGIVVKTRVLPNPAGTYTTLANHDDTKGNQINVGGIMSFVQEAHDNVPATLDMYLDDGRVVSVWAYASVEDTIKIAQKLGLNSTSVNLNDYVNSTWTDEGTSRVLAPVAVYAPVEP